VYNVNLALDALRSAGVPLNSAPPVGRGGRATGGGAGRSSVMGSSSLPGPLAAEDVVDGHRERTLWLLWQVALHLQVPVMVDAHALRCGGQGGFNGRLGRSHVGSPPVCKMAAALGQQEIRRVSELWRWWTIPTA